MSWTYWASLANFHDLVWPQLLDFLLKLGSICANLKSKSEQTQAEHNQRNMGINRKIMQINPKIESQSLKNTYAYMTLISSSLSATYLSFWFLVFLVSTSQFLHFYTCSSFLQSRSLLFTSLYYKDSHEAIQSDLQPLGISNLLQLISHLIWFFFIIVMRILHLFPQEKNLTNLKIKA